MSLLAISLDHLSRVTLFSVESCMGWGLGTSVSPPVASLVWSVRFIMGKGISHSESHGGH